MSWFHIPEIRALDAKAVEDLGFWHYVDSGQAPYAARCTCNGDPAVECIRWDHARESDRCLAARADRTRCNKGVVTGAPFCDFHLERAWAALYAVANCELIDSYRRMSEFDRRCAYEDAGIDEAMVRDARRALDKQGERVYFYRAGDHVKIGRSVNPERRVKSLAGTLAPEGVDVAAGELLGTILGGHYVETNLHWRFSEHRVKGEWFHYGPIANAIAELLAEQRRAA